ncbi:thioredoxin fold domain-containing protein [Acidithiobacillus sp.]
MFVGYLSKPATVKLVSTVRGFVWGHGKPQFTVFIDPNCVFCHQFYKDAVPLVESGKLTVRVVPVAILEQTSFTRAAEILSARRPLTWYLRNERHFVMPPIEQGGLSLKLPVSAVARSDVSHNNAIIRRLDQNHAATPTFVSPSGVVQVGLPAGEFSGLLKMMRSGGAQ